MGCHFLTVGDLFPAYIGYIFLPVPAFLGVTTTCLPQVVALAWQAGSRAAERRTHARSADFRPLDTTYVIT